MKLCPQCAFLYENNQSVCDMDGRTLVRTAPVVLETKPTPPTRMTISLAATSENLTAVSTSRRSSGLPILLIVLAILLSVLVFAQVRRSRSSHAVQSPQSVPSAALDNTPQPPQALQPLPADLVSSTSIAAATQSEQGEESPESPQGSQLTNPAVVPSATRARLATVPTSVGASSGNSRSVILRLTNGARINADEVWERKEGIWYRQAGMVTFLKRSRVSAIERIATPHSRQQSVVNNVAEKSRKPDDRTAPTQLRIRRLESVETKKLSRVNALLKWTGRILKKPFKS